MCAFPEGGRGLFASGAMLAVVLVASACSGGSSGSSSTAPPAQEPAEIEDVIAFLDTLTDGYQP